MRALNRICWMGVVWLAQLLLASHQAVSAEMADIEATLILASNDPAPLDARLDRIAFRLRKIFKFEHYRFMDQKSATLNLPGDVNLVLAKDFNLAIKASGTGKGIRSQVHWTQAGNSLVRSSLILKKGSPAILGGVSYRGGKLILVLRSG